MSPRRHRRMQPPYGTYGADGVGGGPERAENWPDGTWMVRAVPGAGSVKAYRCPGCDQEIRPGTPHVVAWPASGSGSVDDRRHWHAPCWRNRMRRAPKGGSGWYR